MEKKDYILRCEDVRRLLFLGGAYMFKFIKKLFSGWKIRPIRKTPGGKKLKIGVKITR